MSRLGNRYRKRRRMRMRSFRLWDQAKVDWAIGLMQEQAARFADDRRAAREAQVRAILFSSRPDG